MFKWLGGVASALVLLALTSLVGSLLKGPIDDVASRDRLRAEVQLSPWFEKPSEVERAERETPVSSRADEISRLFEQLNDGSYLRGLSSDDYEAARVIITNESSVVVTNINFRLRSPHDADSAVVIDPTGKRQTFKDVDRILVPDLKPGDRAIVFLWGRYSSLLFPDLFETYSSSGRFRVTYDWPRTQEREFGSSVGSFLDRYAGVVFAIAIVFLMIVMTVIAAIWDGYAKSLLKDEELYAQEREKFENDPKKFTPDLKGIASN